MDDCAVDGADADGGGTGDVGARDVGIGDGREMGIGMDCAGRGAYSGGGGLRIVAGYPEKLGVGMLSRVSLGSSLIMVRAASQCK